MNNILMTSNEKSSILKDAFSRIDGFTIEETKDTDAEIRYVLKFGDGAWSRFSDGAWKPITGELTAKLVLSEGNAASELNALKAESFKGLEKQTISVAAALQSGSTIIPTVNKFEVRGRQAKPIVKEFDLPEVKLEMDDGKMPTIYEIEVTKVENGGHANLLASIQGMDGTWSEYQDYTVYLDGKHQATGIRFRGRYSLEPDGELVKITQITVGYQAGELTLFTNGKGVCVTKYHNTKKNLQEIYLSLKHDTVKDVEYHASVAFTEEGGKEMWLPMESISKKPNGEQIVDEQFEYVTQEDEGACGRFALRIDIVQNHGDETQTLGTGTGETVRYPLPHHAILNKIKVQPENAEWTYDDSASTLSVKAPAGTTVTAEYQWKAKPTSMDSMVCVFN